MDLHTEEISSILKKRKEQGDDLIEKEKIKNNLKEMHANVSLVNIDSAYRNKVPKNITEVNKNYLLNNPITTQKGSSELKFYMPNHNYQIGDTLSILNVKSNEKTFSNSLYLFDNFKYMVIYYESHNIDSNYTNYINNLQIESKMLSKVNSSVDISTRFYGNIPINMTLGLLNIKTFNDLYDTNNPEINQNIINLIIDSFSRIGSNDDISKNFLFIPLEFTFTISNIDENNEIFYNNILSNSKIFNIPYVYKITFMELEGIPLNFINADYPITYQRQQGNQEVTNVETDYFYINVKSKAYSNGNFGGDKITISKIIKTIAGYPDASEFTIQLKKNFTNVVRLEMVSSEIPFIENTITEGVNNKLYWQIFDDGDAIYSISLSSGNYTTSSLITTILDEMNKIERINSKNEDIIFNVFEIESNNFTSEIKFKSFANNLLPNSLSSEPITVDGKIYYKLIIKHPNNFVEVKDEIEIVGADKIGVIPKSILNSSFTVYEVDKVRQTYSVILPPFNLQTTAATGFGGLGIKIKTPTKCRFLFNKPDTIGPVLGFRRSGEENSITQFKSAVSNFDNYLYPLRLDSVGNINNDSNLFKVDGSTSYWLLYVNDYKALILNGLEDCFSKILITAVQGEICFNSFVNNPVQFEIPIPSLNELTIKVTDKYGKNVNFINNDFSFTLRVYEIISNPKETKLKNSNYIDEIIKQNN